MPWYLPAIGASGQAHPRSQGLLLGQGSTACPLVTLRCIHLSLTLILHVLEQVSTALSMFIQIISNVNYSLNLCLPFLYIRLFLLFRFTNHAYQYASAPQATSAPLGCLHSYYPHPQCLACASAPLTHSLPGARPGRKLPLLATGTLPGFSYHEAPPAEDHSAGGQCERCTNRPLLRNFFFFQMI